MELQILHTVCIAHALNLVVKKGIDQTPGLGELREKNRKIVAYFRSSTVAKQQLSLYQEQMGKPVHKMIQEVDTRWNSTLEMFTRVYEQRETVGASLAALHTDISPLTSAEYFTIKECIRH